MDAAIAIALNTLAQRSPALTTLSVFVASNLIVLVAAGTVAVILRLPRAERLAQAFRTCVTVALTYGASQIIGALAYRDRPFVALEAIENLIDRAASKSFPSDHAGISFALAFSVLSVATPRARVGLLLGATLVAIGRVLAGVHYPTDVLAGTVLAGIAWFVVRAVSAHRTKPVHPDAGGQVGGASA